MLYAKDFIYLSEVLTYPLVDLKTRKKIGKVVDLSTNFRQTYPPVTGLLVQIAKKKVVYVPWKKISEIDFQKREFLIDGLPEGEGIPSSVSENEILLKKTFFDRQIVDISGLKVVRVNDLHMLREKSNIWLIHIDVGFKGVLRRLGFLRFINGLNKWLFSTDMKDKFIPWKYAQPVTTTNVHGALYLKIPSSRLAEIHPADLADIIEELGYDERKLIFQSMDVQTSAKTLQELSLPVQTQLVENIEAEKIAEVINEMDVDEAVDLLSEVEHDKLEELYTVLPGEKVTEIKELLSHSSYIAGSLMNTEYVSVDRNMTVKEVLGLIRKKYKEIESIYYIYVTDNETLIGVVTLRHLLLAKGPRRIGEIMNENIVKVQVTEKIKSVARVFFKYDFTVIPVVDKENKICGIITIKDALESVYPEIKEGN
jgi:magnesium transporter